MSKEFRIEKKTASDKSFRIEKVMGMFELQKDHLTQTFSGDFNLPDKWNVGVIVGRSGTGKSTIAKNFFSLFSTKYDKKAIIDEMPKDKTVEEITKVFTRVGFSSPPSWLKPYDVLSNGEKMRVDLAKALLSDASTIVFDEFTSVVDRDVAKIVSLVVSKTVRQENKKFVAVTCHYDVLDWLEADWVFSTDEMKMINVKKNDQTYHYEFIDQRQTTGSYLETIII